MGDSATTGPQLQQFPGLALRIQDDRTYQHYEQEPDSSKRDLLNEEPPMQGSPEAEYRRRSRASLDEQASFSGRDADGLRGVLLPSGSLMRLHSGEMQDMQDAYEAQEVVLTGLASTVAAVGTTVGKSIIRSIDNLSTYLVEMSQHLGACPEHEAGPAWTDEQMREVHASRAHGACTVTVASSTDALRSGTQLGTLLKQRTFQTATASSATASPRGDVCRVAPAAGAVEGKAVHGKVAHINAISMLDADDWYVAGYDPQEWQAVVPHRKDE